MAKVCVSYWGFQMILACSWARFAIFEASKGREERFYFCCFFHFILVPLSYLSLSFISSTIFLPLFSLFWEMTKNDSEGLTCR